MKLQRILPEVTKPARYKINEILILADKDWDSVAVKMALAFPDVYEIGMGNLHQYSLPHYQSAG